METATPPNPPGTQAEHMFKNMLQEFAQRASMHLPVYQTFNEGPQHLPNFRSTVIVGGITFTSPCTFHRRREAEQQVAKFALESIGTKIKQEAMALIHNDISFCKIVLNEYATKMKMEFPAYTTSKLEGLLPTFFSSVVFDGKTYEGGLGRNKKMAEQIGARTVIEWLLGQSDKRTTMAEIIKSKDRFFNAMNGGISLMAPQINSLPLEVAVDNSLPLEVASESLPSEVAIDNRPGEIIALGKDVHGGSILPHGNVVPSKVPVDGHTGVIGSLPLEVAIDNSLPLEVASGSLPLEVAIDNRPGEIIALGKDVHDGSILAHGNVVPSKVPVDGHTGVIGSNGEIRHVVSMLAVPAAEHFIPPAAEHFIPPAAENPKEECVCDVLPGSISGGTILPTIGQNNQPEDLLSKHSDHVCNDSRLEQAVQLNTEVTSGGSQTSHFHSTVPATGGKRSRKNKRKRNNSKKIRLGA